jgi:hypothetical protein
MRWHTGSVSKPRSKWKPWVYEPLLGEEYRRGRRCQTRTGDVWFPIVMFLGTLYSFAIDSPKKMRYIAAASRCAGSLKT